MNFVVHHGDCLAVMRTMPDSSVDSIVTDPPYGLSFMGKRWDYDVPAVEVWAECLRVLKPGGYLLAFAGTRTQHRMAVRIEDAGLEIRDMIAWVYSTGFPKSMNLDRLRGDAICGCDGSALPYTHERAEQTTEHQLRPVRGCDVSTAQLAGKECGEVLQQGVQEQGAPIEGREQLSAAEVRAEQSSMEGRSDDIQEARELLGREVCEIAAMGEADGEGRRLHHGASAGDGPAVRSPALEAGGGTSHRPRSDEQRAGESGTVAGQQEPQTRGAWPVCGGCGLPMVPNGLGTALKPALEPITVARKPLAGTVAENVLAHGTGAINIDGCRVHAEDAQAGRKRHGGGIAENHTSFVLPDSNNESPAGRWPANLLHDGSDEVLAEFPDGAPAKAGRTGKRGGSSWHGCEGFGSPEAIGTWPADPGGSAARFFYCAKASRKDRNEGCEGMERLMPRGSNGAVNAVSENRGSRSGPRENHHPTVKPTDLMRYLCRLVTPPGGTVLDPFTGSGSTGKAAVLEGFRFVGIEREAEYVEIARARIDFAVKGNDIPQGDLFEVNP